MKTWIAPLLIMGLSLCLLISIPFMPAGFYVFALPIIFSGFLSSFMILGNQGKGPYLRKIMVWLAVLVGLGFGLSLTTLNPAWLLLALLGIPLTLLWVNYLRFPPHLWKAVWLFRRNKGAEAIRHINESMKSRPNDWKALTIRSDMYLTRIQIADAERDARLAIKLKPDFDEAYNQLGRSLLAQGLYEEAQQALESAQRLRPTNMYLYNIGAVQYRRGNFAAAVDSLTRATASELDHKIYNLLAHYYLGRALEANGEPEKAARAFKKMHFYREDLRPVMENLNKYPEYIETIAFREDLADLQKRISN